MGVVSGPLSVVRCHLLDRYQFTGAALELDASGGFDLFLDLELSEGVDGGLDEVLGTGRAVGLGEDVGDADQLEAGSDALARGDAGSRARRDEHDRAGAALTGDGVGDGAALEADLEHLLAGVLGALLDGVGDLVGLAVSDADVSLAVADDDQCAEREGSPALDDLGAAVDADDGGFDAGL